ncbi:acetate--CoA ligase [Mycobacterium frederiksbergense]|uniref:Acetyl-coenzyme A synthetase n=1 Tax=Mycolicibacterium frederiksbergense TaxID=117567 RepID=A0A6H0S5Y5_9MYCO|nr:acetate--CoA ligase [Mycolicibacterium frederiksbergense]MCV7047154.1 acetate--CoA ligase [Mycolicibacterium frederiksbergense]MDO0974458.1 acetate--CoA ligase [Mycolicibacterium frederiksbergense]QIV82570.1 acetate--CoA ligase [Mycolicibacterium frederiksbergense]
MSNTTATHTGVPSAYPPPADFAANANATSDLYDAAEADRLGFWAEQANRLAWQTPFEEVLDWSDAPFAKWFVGGKLNVAYNCVDRHVEAGNGDRVAIHWVGEPVDDARTLTYSELKDEVCKAANALTELGLVSGDRVAIYMPMVPEAIVSMLACARLGIMHSVVFAGYSASALRARIDDAEAKLVITTDGQYRRGKAASLKEAVDDAVEASESVEHVLVVRRTGIDITWTEGRDIWWHEAVDGASTVHEPEAFDAEHPLFLLYTSGTTGKPKGIVHTTGGYLTQSSYTHFNVFDVKPESDVYWCTADIGWVTGHTYIVYGPLSNGVTQVVYEGTPTSPTEHRHFEIIEKYGVTIYYTAPTLVRTFMKLGRQIPADHDLSSLRLLGSVGEPINPEAWRWYRTVFGDDKTPIVDTWWQTETGSIMISPLPGVTSTKPGSAMRPLPGISAKIVDDEGNELKPGTDHGEQANGYLVLDKPWPSMLRGIWGDPERFKETYWSRFAEQGWYFAGDGARYGSDGEIWVLGRIDDVMNISGHRISTAEVESALVGHAGVAEAAVVGATDEQTGQAICAFVILKASAHGGAEGMVDELRAEVAKEISPIAKPREIHVVPELPKTRSGKIMRRLLRDVAEGRELGDTSTLLDPSVFEAIRASK